MLWRLQGSEVFAKRTAQPTSDHPRKANDEESRSKGDEDGVCNSEDLKAGPTGLTRLLFPTELLAKLSERRSHIRGVEGPLTS